MKLKLHVWRQKGPKAPGKLETYEANHVSPDQSFLEMLDEVNEVLVKEGKDPIAFDHDCREGICGMCSQVINGVPHGGQDRTTVCQLHMRSFKDGDEIFIEPWKARAFPIIKDLAVDRYCLRQHHRGGWLHLLPHRRRGRRQRYPDRQGSRRLRHGRGRVHRLRGVCRLLPEQLGDALCQQQGRPAGGAAAGAGGSQTPRHGHARRGQSARFRQLHQPLRVPGGVPEGDQRQVHRQAQPRVHQGDVLLLELLSA